MLNYFSKLLLVQCRLSLLVLFHFKLPSVESYGEMLYFQCVLWYHGGQRLMKEGKKNTLYS